MSTKTWTGAINSHWRNKGNWSPAGIPGAGSDVVIDTGAPVASASIGTVDSITDSSDLSFESAGTNTVTTFLDNTGSLNVDDNAGEGGTILDIGGTLTNSGSLTIGNATLSASDTVTAASLDNTATGTINLTGSSANQALLDVTSAAGFGAAEILTGTVNLSGDSAIEFASGQITTIATSGSLQLNGNSAFVEDSAALGSNSALKGLTDVAGVLDLTDASVSTAGSLVNSGGITLDSSSLKVARNLTNKGTFTVNGSQATIGALSNSGTLIVDEGSVSTTALNNSGGIGLEGGREGALLDVTGSAGFGASGVLSGDVGLEDDTGIEFASGQITTIAADASLFLEGGAFIEDSKALGSNSALAGLASIGVGAELLLNGGASVSTTGSLVNSGFIQAEGSSLNIAGKLTNKGTVTLEGSSQVGALSNTGVIHVFGLLDVTTGAAGFGTVGTVTGTVSDAGAIEFLSGEIRTIASGASLDLGGNSFIENSTALGSNSALTGLATVGGGLTLNGASVSTTGALTNSGFIGLGNGSTLSIADGLTNTGTLDIGNSDLVYSDSVTANSFVNSGTVDLAGSSAFAALNVSGALTNNGSISIATDTETLAGAVGGAGSFSLSSANLQFDSSVSSGQTINETGADSLTLEQAQSFAATISGFGIGDSIDAANFLLSGTTFNFHENSTGTGGTLTLHDGSLTAHILMTGVYSHESFTLAPDSGTGTLVKFA
jgi:hypothetical protein